MLGENGQKRELARPKSFMQQPVSESLTFCPVGPGVRFPPFAAMPGWIHPPALSDGPFSNDPMTSTSASGASQFIPEGAGTVKTTAGCFFACLRAS